MEEVSVYLAIFMYFPRISSGDCESYIGIQPAVSRSWSIDLGRRFLRAEGRWSIEAALLHKLSIKWHSTIQSMEGMVEGVFCKEWSMNK